MMVLKKSNVNRTFSDLLGIFSRRIVALKKPKLTHLNRLRSKLLSKISNIFFSKVVIDEPASACIQQREVNRSNVVLPAVI